MERVKKGERYWSILFDRLFNDDGFCVIWHCEDWEDDVFSEIRFEQHNYFHTKEEADAMAKKIRAVLKGAVVIELPSEEEIESEVQGSASFITSGHDRVYAADGVGRILGDTTYEEIADRLRGMIDWLKSKIVK